MPPKNNPKNNACEKIYRQKKRHSRPGERDSIHPNLKSYSFKRGQPAKA
jgi:hypothetical protein